MALLPDYCSIAIGSRWGVANERHGNGWVAISESRVYRHRRLVCKVTQDLTITPLTLSFPYMSRNSRPSSGSALFEATLNGHVDRPFLPRLKNDPSPYDIPPRLEDYRSAEGTSRERRLRRLWGQLPPTGRDQRDGTRVVMPIAFTHVDDLTPERAAQLREMYDVELLRRCRDPSSVRDGDSHALEVDWEGFRAYANSKEAGTFDLPMIGSWLN